MGNKVTVDGLADAIAKELSEYSQEVTDGLKSDIKTVAKECVAEIRQNSPREEKGRRKGRYAKGWTSKTEYENREDIRIVVHNKTDYQLAHLLEYGHALRGGGRSKAFPHIEPAEKHAEEKLMRKVKVLVRK